MKKIIAANWKLNHGPREASRFFEQWNELGFKGPNSVLFFPPALVAGDVARSLSDINASGRLTRLEWGLQNFWSQSQGAFTGENSLSVAKEMGARWALVGHSERRSLFGETDALLRKKLEFALVTGLRPIFCIGESLAERQATKTFDILSLQLNSAFEGLSLPQGAEAPVVAYEPVWAIGTGVVATPTQVREAHNWIHTHLVKLGFSESPILYGGSVKADNAGELGSIPHVDGFLVGGASLDAASFLAIARST